MERPDSKKLRIKRSFIFIVILFMLVILFSTYCSREWSNSLDVDDPSIPPSVTTESASSLTANMASLNGLVSTNNLSTVVGFEYGETITYGRTIPGSPAIIQELEPKLFTAQLAGLSPDTEYHFRASATNDIGTSYGDDNIFKTLPMENFVSKELVFQDSRLSVISDIVYRELDSSAGPEFGIASSKGAVFLDNDFQIKSVILFSSRAAHVDFFDVDSDGLSEFINRGSWSYDASLIDHQGNVVWTYGGDSAVNDMSVGDMDLDGIADFVVGFNGAVGIHLVDINGKNVWKQSDGNVWHVEFVDTNGDGKLEIIHSNAAGELTVRDRQGNIINRTRPAPYFSNFSICRWPTQNDREYALLARDDTIWLFDFDGKSPKQYNAPQFGSAGAPRGIAFTIGNLSGYFAVIVNIRNENKAILYMYNPQGQLEYQEILPEASEAIAAVKLEPSGKDVLLVGGNTRVWKYSF